MKIQYIRKLIGLAGVGSDESETAQSWSRYYAAFMVIVAIFLLLQVYFERKQHIPLTMSAYGNWVVWAAFVIEVVTLLVLVKHKVRYLSGNWLNLVIIVGGFPLIWDHTPWIPVLRLLQLLLALRLALPVWDTSIHILARNHLGATLLVCFIITILWGVLLSVVDPAIHTPWDGIWWAWETATTVGYGDIVPVSAIGRILGGILMLMGIGLISLLAANFSAYFISKNAFFKKEREELLEVLKHMQDRLDKIEKRLK